MTEERAPYYPAPREMTWEDLHAPCTHKRRRILIGVQRHSAANRVPFARVTCADCGYEGKELYHDLDIVGVV